MVKKHKDKPRSQEEIFESLVDLSTRSQKDFVAELENLVGRNVSEAILKKRLSHSGIIEYVRTTIMTKSSVRTPQRRIRPNHLGKDASVGSI